MSTMKQPLKILLAVGTAGFATGLAVFGWPAKVKDNATIHLANGVQVAPVEVRSDDMAKLLNAFPWIYSGCTSNGRG